MLGVAVHKEILQQKGVLGSIDLKEAVEQRLEPLGREMKNYGPRQRIRGEKNEDRDLVVYALWEKGLFRNEEIGQVFGLSYSAVSHIVKDGKVRIKETPRLGSRAKRLNS